MKRNNWLGLPPSLFIGAVILCVAVLTVINCSKKNKNPVTPNSNSCPVLTTTKVSEITRTTAKCGGTITSDGGAAVTARGVCWGTSQTPTIADHKTTDGAGTGSFTSLITELTGNTEYYARAYATNSEGTGYGDAVPFMPAVADVDGNTYQVVKIGNQWWMAENLKVTHYRNGGAIPNATGNADWSSRIISGAYCSYNNDTTYTAVYGNLYNWPAVNDIRNIAPVGWHVPSDEEWKELEMTLGMSKAEADAEGWRGTSQGGKLKEAGTAHWKSPNTGATNESGFSALPGGYRADVGTFYDIDSNAYFWSSTSLPNLCAYGRVLSSSHSGVSRKFSIGSWGFSVRCLRGEKPAVNP